MIDPVELKPRGGRGAPPLAIASRRKRTEGSGQREGFSFLQALAPPERKDLWLQQICGYNGSVMKRALSSRPPGSCLSLPAGRSPQPGLAFPSAAQVILKRK